LLNLKLDGLSMTILPLFYSNVKKKLGTNVQSTSQDPESTVAGPRPATTEEITSRWRAGQKRSMWLVVGMFTFAFTFLFVIQNIAGYLAYHGYGVRHDYGIVLNQMDWADSAAEGGGPLAVVYRWEHVPWRTCDSVKMEVLKDDYGQPVIIQRGQPENGNSRGYDIEDLLLSTSYHIPLRSRRDTSVYILMTYNEGGPTRQLDFRTYTKFIKEFGFGSVEVVQSVAAESSDLKESFEVETQELLRQEIKRRCSPSN